jgi:predicted acylesterase/phospholipase RssA
MLRAFKETGLMPDLVIGSSAGALNVVAFATDPSPAGLLAAVTGRELGGRAPCEAFFLGGA